MGIAACHTRRLRKGRAKRFVCPVSKIFVRRILFLLYMVLYNAMLCWSDGWLGTGASGVAISGVEISAVLCAALCVFCGSTVS